MSDKRDLVRNKIIRMQNECANALHERSCDSCPYDPECTFLMAFGDWCHMHTQRKIGDEDLERLVDQVMEIEDYEELLEIKQ